MTPEEDEWIKVYTELSDMLPWDPASEEYHHFNDLLAKLFVQANRWGQAKAVAKLRDWADTFGDTPTQHAIRLVVNEAADRILEEEE